MAGRGAGKWWMRHFEVDGFCRRSRRFGRAGGSLLAVLVVVLIASHCGRPPAERQSEEASAQRWDPQGWRAETAVQLERVEVHLPLLHEVVQLGNVRNRHVEIRRSHELLSASEQSVPPVPWGVMDETAGMHRNYANAVTNLRWSAELLLWSVRPEISEEQRQSYRRDARYYLNLGTDQLDKARVALFGTTP